ncbi:MULTISPECIES: RHS repeat-associated core domain-containing protein [Pirellulaceae]|nr:MULTISPECIES: RHS repeat-associated core domain-containing protein [Pirellulaceae]
MNPFTAYVNIHFSGAATFTIKIVFDGGDPNGPSNVAEDSANETPPTCDCNCGCSAKGFPEKASKPAENSGDTKPVTINATLTGERPPGSVMAVAWQLVGGAVETVYYSLDGLPSSGEITLPLTHVFNTSSLATGAYNYTAKLSSTAFDSALNNFNFSGELLVSKPNDALGNGVVDDLAKLTTSADGKLLDLGNGNLTHFLDNLDGTYSAANDPYSQLAWDSGSSTYTLTNQEGETYTFNSAGLATTKKDKRGRETSYSYTDADGDSVADEISSITKHGGQTTSYGYTSSKLTTITDELGRVTSYTYDVNDRIETITSPDPDGAGSLVPIVNTYSYDSTGRVNSIAKSNGETIQYVRDSSGALIESISPDGSSTEYNNYAYRNLPASGTGTLMNPASLTLEGDAWGEMTTDGVTTYYKTDRKGNLLAVKDAEGNVTTYDRNAAGYVTKITEADPDGPGALEAAVYEYSYDSSGNILTETLPDDSVRTWEYHATWNEPIKFIDANGNITLYAYDATNQWLLTETIIIGEIDDAINLETDDLTTTYTYTGAPVGVTDPPIGLVESITEADGVVTEFGYDVDGNRTSVTYAVGTADEATILATYDAAGNMLTETDELGNVTTYTYDNFDRVTSVTTADPDGAGPQAATVVTYTYNDFDLLATESINGRTTTYTYNTKGQVTSVTEADPDGAGSLTAPVTSYTYDSDGNILTITDPLGNVTTYGYTDGLLTSITEADPDGAGPQTAPVTSYTYDDAGRILTVTDPLGQVTTYNYDNLGRQISVSLPDPDGAGALTALSSTTVYDAFGRFVSETDFSGITTTYTYDSESNLLTETTPLGTTTYTYDELNRLVEVETADPDGAGALAALVNTYSYTATGQIASVTTPKGTTSHTYDNRRRRTSVTLPDPDGVGGQSAPVSSTTYDDAGNVLTETDALGNVTTYEYDDLNRVIKITSPDPDGVGAMTSPVTEYGYDEFGQLVSMTDPNGGVTTYEYDDLGRQTKVIYADPDGAGAQSSPEVSFVYDANDRLTSMTDELGNVTTYAYDNLGRQISVTLPDPDGAGSATSPVYSYEYDANGQLLSETDPLGRTTSYTYDAMGRLLTETLPDPDGIAPAGPLAAPVTTYTYNSSGQLASVTDAESQTVSYTYNSADLIATMTDPRGTTVYAYDALGRQIAIYEPDPDGAGSQQAPVTLYQYNDDGELAATITRDGKTSYEYDNLGRITKITEADPDDVGLALGSALGSGTGATGSATGGPEIVVTDGVLEGLVLTDGSSTVGFGTVDVGSTAIRTFEITNIGDSPLTISSITLPSVFKIISYSDDEIAAGESTTITVQFTPTTVASYSATLTINNDDNDESSFEVQLTGSGQASTNGSEVAASTSFTYDDVGRTTSETDALGHTTSYEYDHLGRVVKKTDAELGETTYTYDANGNRLTLTDPVSNTTTWTYDALNRMLTNTNELNDTRTYEYDAAGNVVEYTDRNGRVTVYEYDDLQRRTAEKWIDGVNVERTLSYTFDAASQLTSASDPAATYTFTYDNLGRNTSTTHDLAALGFDVVIDEAYDALGRRTSLAAEIDGTDDLINTYSYDYLNRMTQVTQASQSGGNAVTEKRVDFAYDAEDKGQFTSITRYADLTGTELVATSTYGYDAADRLTSLTHADGGSSTLAGYTWAYDEGNRLTAFTVYGYSAEDATYSYDDTDQLTGADRSGISSDESYTYDENGNRTNTGYSTGTNNQLLSDGTYNYTFDAEGNLTQRTSIADGSYAVYEWDYRNHLISVTDYDASDVKQQKVEYVYDYSNRMIGREHDTDGDGTVDTSGTFVYDGNQIILVLDDAGDVDHRLLWGPNVDQVLADENAAGDVYWALTDQLNTIRDWAEYDDVADTTSVVNHIAYDSFGIVLSETNGSLDTAGFGFTARYLDEATGLQYNSERWYIASLGRWASQDPIEFEAEDPNLYRYVGNDPILFNDPDGLKKRWVGTYPVEGTGHHPIPVELWLEFGFDESLYWFLDSYGNIQPKDNTHNMTAHGSSTGYTAYAREALRQRLHDRLDDSRKLSVHEQQEFIKRFIDDISDESACKSETERFLHEFNVAAEEGVSEVKRWKNDVHGRKRFPEKPFPVTSIKIAGLRPISNAKLRKILSYLGDTADLTAKYGGKMLPLIGALMAYNQLRSDGKSHEEAVAIAAIDELHPFPVGAQELDQFVNGIADRYRDRIESALDHNRRLNEIYDGLSKDPQNSIIPLRARGTVCPPDRREIPDRHF